MPGTEAGRGGERKVSKSPLHHVFSEEEAEEEEMHKLRPYVLAVLTGQNYFNVLVI